MELSPQMEERKAYVFGREVAYTARGPADAEYAYVGINGLLGGGDSFWPVIEGVPAGWRVVLPDLPGCGGSRPLQPPHRHDVEGYVIWLRAFLQELGLDDRKVVLASVATGAPISIRYGVRYQEQVVGQVLHLPFLGKVAINPKWARPVVAYSLLLPQVRSLVDRLRSSDALMHRIILHEPPDAIPELAERDIHHKQQGDLRAAGELLHDLMLTEARLEMKALTHPVLILASEHDFSCPLPVLEPVVRGRPYCAVYVYRGGQHSWNEEFIDEMNREISGFLLQVERSADRAVPSHA